MKSASFVFGVAVSSVCGFFLGLAPWWWPLNDSPPEAQSKARMREMAQEIRQYYAERGELPNSLSELVLRHDDGVDSFVNGWGGPIVYSMSNGTTVLLKTCESVSSYGSELRQTFTLQFDVASKDL